MRKMQLIGILAIVAVAVFAADHGKDAKPASTDWAMNATIIEACSCPMFCPCYFGTAPAAHHEHGSEEAKHFCKFNNAFKVNKGHYGATKLDGAKFWLAGDLGDDFGDGEIEWAILTFDPSVTKEQREGVGAIIGHVYPVKIKSMKIAPDTAIEWKATKDRAEARMDGGKTAEVVLVRYPGNTDDPIVIKNLRYFGVPRNDGFVLMPNEIEAYRGGDHPFVYHDSNGFMITIDIKSSDIKPAETKPGM